MNPKSIVAVSTFCIILAISTLLSSSIIETVEKGSYVIKQAAITGDITAHMSPGMFYQGFGDVTIFPKAYTYNFIKDADEGGNKDDSVKVTFSDGSSTQISGSVRVIMPKTTQTAIELATDHGFSDMNGFVEDLVKKHVRTAIRLTATLMTAQESYNTKRAEFTSIVTDMLNKGNYSTEPKKVDIKDPITGEITTRTFNTPKLDDKGNIIISQNPIEGMGISFTNVDIKNMVYPPKILEQIAQQQKAYMGIATAAAKAKEAEQKEKTAVAEGKAEVARIKYTEEAEKIKKVVKAQANKEEAIIKANQQKAVAELEKDAAEFTKKKEILLGEGEASRKRAVLAADGALSKKLAALIKIHGYYATQIGKHKWVPNVVIGGNGKGNNNNAAIDLINLMSANFAKELSVDLNLPKNK